MKKTWIALGTAAATFPAVAIAVPLSLNASNNNPTGTNIVLSQSTGSIGSIGATVVISANSQNLSGHIQWKYPNKPQSVSVQGTPSDNNIVFILNTNVDVNTTFDVVAENNGITSNTITISVIAPIDTLTIDYVDHNYLSYLNDLVTIRRVDTQTHHSTTQWHYVLPSTGHVSVIQENDTEIIFKANQQIISNDGFFEVTCTNNNGDTSNPLPVALIPPQTTINLTFQDGDDTLTGPGNVVTINANMINPYGTTNWHYGNMPATVHPLLESNGSISFTNPEAILTPGSFTVWADNNNGNSNAVTVRLIKADMANKISVSGSGIVYDGYQDTNNPHISAAIWQPGHYEYNAKLFDSDGTLDGVQDAIFVPGQSAPFINVTPDDENHTLVVSWARDVSLPTFDDPVVVNFSVHSASNPSLQVEIVVNIDFYTISSVTWVGTQPSTLTGTHGSAKFNAIVNGQGVIGDKFVSWDVKQQNGQPLPHGDWQFTMAEGIPNAETLIFGWTYEGTTDAALNLVVTAYSHKNPDMYVMTNVTLTAKATTGVTITGDQYIKAYAGVQGSKPYHANYSGSEPDTNTDWSILTIDDVPYDSSAVKDNIKLTVNQVGDPVAYLQWDDSTPTKSAAGGSYNVVLQAALTNKPDVIKTSYPVQLHVAGPVDYVDVTWGSDSSQTVWSSDITDPISVAFTATVYGVGGVTVDQDVIWSYSIESTSGAGDFGCWINGGGLFTAFDKSTYHVSGIITITAKSLQDPTKLFTTRDLTFNF